MHALKLCVLAICALTAQLVPAQSFPDARYKVSVRLPGATQPLRGGQELVGLLATASDPNSVYDLPAPVLQRNAAYKLLVTITDPSGLAQDFTGSPRLRYETFNCLTVTSDGMLRVIPLTGAVCSLPNNPQLWVVLTDVGGNPVAMNQYLFKVSDLVGDLNGDGRIDIDDLAMVRARSGQPTYPGDPYDVNGDGTIDVADIRALQLRCTPNPSCAKSP